ncbi:MAG: protein-tyrosine phosphatase family protein [Desertimonas sp.]
MAWPSNRSLDGGLDQIPVPGQPGALWLCGKHLVGGDPHAALARVGKPAVIVCLNEVHELIDRYPGYVRWLTDEHGRQALWHPIPDLHAPELDDAVALAAELAERVGRGEHVIVHCGAGIGRAGTMAAATLMTLGVPRVEALATVATHRPMAGPEAGPQHDLLHALDTRIHGFS